MGGILHDGRKDMEDDFEATLTNHRSGSDEGDVLAPIDDNTHT